MTKTIRIALSIAALATFIGCTSAQRPEVETVGTLVSTTGAVYQQPVHATTDLAHTTLVTSDEMEVR